MSWKESRHKAHRPKKKKCQKKKRKKNPKQVRTLIYLFGFQLRHWFQSVFLGHQFFFPKKKRLQHSRYDPLFGKKKPILETNTFLGGGFKYFFFHPYLGKISILTNIFQMGWNHHLDLEGCNFGRFATFLWDFSLLVPVGAWWFPLTLSYTSKKTPKSWKTDSRVTPAKLMLGKVRVFDRCDRCELPKTVSGRLPNIALDTGRIPWVWCPFFGGHNKNLFQKVTESMNWQGIYPP